jgi:hypothetical protein
LELRKIEAQATGGKLPFFSAVPPVRSQHFSRTAEGNDLHTRAQQYRRLRGAAETEKGNVAVAKLEINNHEVFLPAFNDPGGMHSEDKLIAQIRELQKEGNVTLKALYTERRPCDEWSSNCEQKLANEFGSDLTVYHGNLK